MDYDGDLRVLALMRIDEDMIRLLEEEDISRGSVNEPEWIRLGLITGSNGLRYGWSVRSNKIRREKYMVMNYRWEVRRGTCIIHKGYC